MERQRKDELNKDSTSQLHRLVVITGGRANGHTCGDEGHSEYIPQRMNPGGKVSNPQSDIESRFRTKTIHKIYKQGLISIFCFLPLHPRMLKGSFTYITATCFSSKYTSQRASTLA